MPLKVMTILGTRPDIIKLSCILQAFDQNFQHVLVHTGQNYDFELNQIFFDQLGIRKPDYFLEVAEGGVAKTIGNVISRTDEVMEKENPDAVFIYGDTNSSLSCISVKRRKIPLFHMEAGNRCFDQRVPEEINRKVVDHLSDINLVHSEHARRYLLREGLKPETVIKTGTPMIEVLERYAKGIEESQVLNDLNLKPRDFFVVSAHREENIDSEENFSNLMDTLKEMANKYDKKIIFSAHPRTRNKIEQQGVGDLDPRISFMKPLGFLDYVKLQKESYCVVSDSGTITEESSILNFPAITIRNAHERPEGMDVGTIVMSGLKKERVLQSIDMVVRQSDSCQRPILDIEDYRSNKVSNQVVRIVQSYTDYINRTVWSKPL